MELKKHTRKVKSLFGGEERGVSPVIGVILMVAITVILAAVIGTFVLGLGGDLDATPQASTSIVGSDTDTDTITVEHRGGDALAADNTDVVIRINDGSDLDERITLSEAGDMEDRSSLRSGDRVTFDISDGEDFDDNHNLDDADDIEIIFVDESSGERISGMTHTA